MVKVFFSPSLVINLLTHSPPCDLPCVCLSVLISVGIWDPVRDPDLSVLTGGGQCGALHEENLLQTSAALLYRPGYWHALLQRPVSAHPRGSVTLLLHYSITSAEGAATALHVVYSRAAQKVKSKVCQESCVCI